MKFLVLGSNGMAGHTIALYLKEQGHEVYGFARKNSIYCQTIIGDASDSAKLTSIINEGHFDSIINCIGILNQYAQQDKARAAYLNAYFPHFLATVTDGTDTQIIHMSTDCVFSGLRGQYTEDDLPDGESFYDRSKALGELNDSKNITLRSSIVGPDTNPNGIGLLNWFLNQTSGTSSSSTMNINGYTKAIWTGQTTLQLAKTMEEAALVKAHGLINAVPNESITKYDLLGLLNKYFRNNTVHITPSDEMAADKSLRRTRFDFHYIIPSYEDMIVDLAIWMNKYKAMYPHYNL